jgi:hypothetical protein
MQARLPGLKLYSPADEWIQMEVHGITIYATPDKGGQIEAHPETGLPTKCDGITDIRGRVVNQKDSSGKKIEGQDAYARMTFLIHKERFGEMGICWLPGADPDEDEQYRVMAKEQWLKYQSDVDDKIIERRREFVSNWRKNPAKQGAKAPAPTPRENAAIERSELRERVKTYLYSCDVDGCLGYATNEWPKFSGHMAAAHDIVATQTDTGYKLKLPDGGTMNVGEAKALDGKPVPVDPDAEVEEESPIAAASRRLSETQENARVVPRRKARG